MFGFAILIGIYSYFILALGLLGILYKGYLILLSILYVLIILYSIRQKFKRSILVQGYSLIRSKKTYILLLGLIVFQATVNLIGALGPELGFDALWYHLTIPKLYLENHSIFYIPGGLLYYSAMPKLAEMLYISALALNGEILAKLVHFSFGILSCIAIFKLSREFFSPKLSLIAVVIFYSNLVVGWQSITAYVDLARTFFELMALWGFVKFWKSGEKKWLIESAVMLGLAISTKLLAVGSLIIFSVLIVLLLLFKSPPRRSPSLRLRSGRVGHLRGVLSVLSVYWIISLLISLPWFVFSYVNTGNPIFPFFTDLYNVGFNSELLSPLRFARDIWGMFMELSDPITPIYVIFLPFVILFFFRRLRDSGRAPIKSGLARMTELKIVAAYSLLAIIIWYFTPRTGGGRFILPYLPAFSIVAAGVFEMTKNKNLNAVLLGIVIFTSIMSISFRGVANSRYIPIVLGMQTKDEFLSDSLNFSYGDFYDTDNYFKKNIKSNDKVLLYGFHNLYYVEFPHIDSSWVKNGELFNYVSVQGEDLPERFKDWNLVYQNSKTKVRLYSKGEIKWSY